MICDQLEVPQNFRLTDVGVERAGDHDAVDPVRDQTVYSLQHPRGARLHDADKQWLVVLLGGQRLDHLDRLARGEVVPLAHGAEREDTGGALPDQVGPQVPQRVEVELPVRREGVQIGGTTPPIELNRADVSVLSATMIVSPDLLLFAFVQCPQGRAPLSSAHAVAWPRA